MEKYKIEKTKVDNLKELQLCHKSAFPNSLGAKLGSKFRSKMLEWYVVNERGVLFHIIEKNKIIGYCGGVKTEKSGLGGAASNITQYAFNVFLWSFIKRPWLIFHKESIKKLSLIKKNILIKLGLKKINNKISGQEVKKFRPFWGLVVIGISNNHQGKGFGSLLLKHFETLARQDDVSLIMLTVLAKNVQAINAYQKNNWVIVEQNDTSLKLEKEL